MQILLKFRRMLRKGILEKHTFLTCIGLSAILISLAGCTSFGTIVLPKNRQGFGGAMIVSEEQQLLLNLVRMQFEDRPVFVNVDSITTSNSLSANASGNYSYSSSPSRSVVEDFVSRSFGLSRSYGFSPNLSYSDSPTVSYSPLQGERFMRNILQPISMPDVYLLISSGWSPEKVMRVVFDRIYDMENRGRLVDTYTEGIPDTKRFEEFTKLLGRLSRQNKVYFSVGKVDQIVLKPQKVTYNF